MAEKVVAYVVRFESYLLTYPKIFLLPACRVTRKFLTIPLGHYIQNSIEMKHITSLLLHINPVLPIIILARTCLSSMQDNLGESKKMGVQQ